MSSKTAILAVRIVTDAKDATQGYKQAETSAAAFESSLNKVAIASAAALAGIVAMAVQAGNAASNLQQASGAVESVFGAQAAAVDKLADNAARAVGLSERAYKETAAVLGAQLKNMGVSTDQLVGQTDSLITKGADLAATFGGSTADAVSALSSLLRGERDPIERYGVSIKQADINSRLASLGLTGLTGDAARAAETQATLALLTEQTADATGMFAAESDTAAGSQQIANALYEEALATLGEGLLPLMVWGAVVAGDLAEGFAQNSEFLTPLIIAFGGFVAILASGILAIKAYRAIAEVATAAQLLWNVAMTANPIGLVIIAVGLLIAIIVLMVTHWEEVGAVAQDVIDNIVGWIEGLIGWITDGINGLARLFGMQSDLVKFDGFGGQIEHTGEPGFAAAEVDPGTGGWPTWAATPTTPSPQTQTGDTFVFNISGALDAQSTARQIREIVQDDQRRRGSLAAGGQSAW